MKYVLIVITGVLLVTLAGLAYLYSQKERTAFFYNQKVFTEFKGTIELESKLLKESESDKKFLDSLSQLISSGRVDLKELYNEKSQSLFLKNQEQSEKYTADIWRFINEGVQEYGKKESYTYIFGATGDGGLMYAKEGKDITPEIIEFVNTKYKTGD